MPSEQTLIRQYQTKYLAQLYNIAPGYSQSVYDLLSKPEFMFSDVKERAETAHQWYKEEKFRPSEKGIPSGCPPSLSVYN